MVREDPYARMLADTHELHSEGKLSWREGLVHLSWGAVLSGVITILVVQLILGLLGIALGTVSMTGPQPKSWEISRIMGGWMLVASSLAALCGGLVTSRLGTSARLSSSILHGLVAWGLSIFASSTLLGQTYVMFASGPMAVMAQAMLLWQNYGGTNNVLSDASTLVLLRQASAWTAMSLMAGVIATSAGTTLGTPRQTFAESVH